MIYIYTTDNRKPRVWQDLAEAKAWIESDRLVEAKEGPTWWEQEDRWILAVRWRSELAVLWKVMV
jgi:hypothetical protein